MNQNDIDALKASGLKPIVIDENFDISSLDKLWENSGHGTRREDIFAAFDAGIKSAKAGLPLDWALLRQQKDWLSGFRTGEDSEYAEGLINLLDYLQDRAVDTGQATELEVFGIEENPERNE